MTERLPRILHDQLAKSIWDLGRVSMAHIVSIAPAPAYVKGEIDIDNEALEPEFLIVNREDFYKKIPEEVNLTINSLDVFVPDPSFKMYTWQRLSMNTRHHTHEFTRGVILMDDNARTIAPQLDMPAEGRRRRRGTQAWRAVQSGGNLQVFDAEMAEEFIQTTTRFREHILRSNNS